MFYLYSLYFLTLLLLITLVDKLNLFGWKIHPFGWEATERYCSVQVLYDDTAKEYLASRKVTPDDYVKELLVRTNRIYYDQLFGDYRLKFYLQKLSPIGNMLCTYARYPDLCGDGEHEGHMLHAVGVSQIIAESMMGKPCLFLLITHRELTSEGNFAVPSFSVSNANQHEYTKHLFGACDYERHYTSPEDYVRGNTIVLSSRYGRVDYERMSLLMAYEICQAFGCEPNDPFGDPSGCLMDGTPEERTKKFSDSSVSAISDRIKMILADKPQNLNNCLEETQPSN